MTAARLLTFALLATLLATPNASAQGSGVAWRTDFEQAKLAAKESGKLLLVHFWTETCGPCRRLDATVFNQPSVAQAIEKHYVPVKLNADHSPELARSFRITRVPTDVVLTSDGKVADKFVSSGTPLDYVAKLTQVARAEVTKAGAAFALAAAESPYGPVVNNAYAGLLAPPAANKQPAVEAEPPKSETPPTDRYQPATDPGTTTPKIEVNPYAAVQQPPARPKPPAQQPAPETPATASSGQSVAAAALQLPSGAPPLGFEGFCTVTMKQKNQWQKGDAKFGVIHRGRTYLFAGASERDAFFQAPDSFAPALSGADAVLAVERGKAVPGSRQFALEYDGLFYLFSSEETLNAFWQNSERYAAGVRQALASDPTRRR